MPEWYLIQLSFECSYNSSILYVLDIFYYIIKSLILKIKYRIFEKYAH